MSNFVIVISTRNPTLRLELVSNILHIIELHPEFDIIVVDSCSDDISYLNKICHFRNVKIILDNRNFPTGALFKAYTSYPNYEKYVLVHDSFIINTSLLSVVNSIKTFTPFYWFPANNDVGEFTINKKKTVLNIFRNTQISRCAGFSSLEEKVYFETVLSILNLPIPSFFEGVFGPMFIIKNSELKIFNSSLTLEMLPKSKYQETAFERIWGIFASHYFSASIGRSAILGNWLDKNKVLNSDFLKIKYSSVRN